MVRKSSIYILFILLFVLIPGQLFSLGLGEIEVNSALNQPLDAQINLIAARDDEFEEMRVELAPANVFDRVGVPRPYFLTQLKFQPVKVPGGGTVIRVTSKDPVREPFLTFLVEVTWPKGRLLREYTVLLDPPEFAQQQAPQIAAPVTTPVEQVPVEETIVETQPVVRNQPEVIATEDLETIREQMDKELGLDQQEAIDVVEETPVADVIEEAEIIEEVEPSVEEIEEAVTETIVETQAAPQATYENLENDVIIPEDIPGAEEVMTSDSVETIDAEVVSESEVYTQAVSGEVVVAAGDTLSKIARSANQGRASSLNQMMLAIQQANPSAFINDNVNLLKKGAVLRIPEEGEVSSVSSSEARNVIAQQNALWKEYRSKTGQIPAVNVDAPSLVTEENTSTAEAAEKALKEASKQSETQQELNILASDNSNKSSNTQVAGGEEIKRLQKEINLAKELAASRGKEAEDLKGRVAALESMLEKKEKILTIQNQQLKDLQSQLSSDKEKAAEIEKTVKEKAALEAQLKAEQEAQKTAEAAKAKAEEEAKKAAEMAAAAKLEAEAKAKEEADKAAEMAAAAKEEAEAKAKEMAAKVETPLSKPRLEPLPDWDSLPEIEPVPEQIAETTPEETPVEKPAETKPVEKPKTVVEKPAEVEVGLVGKVLGFLDEYKSKLQVGSGILAVLLGGLWFWRRKQVKTVELSGLGDMPMDAMEDGAAFDDILDETIVTSDTGPDAQITDDDMSAMDDFEDMGSTPTAPAGEADGVEAEDVLDEADVYISYGLHQQAQDLLTDAIAKEPGRNDYKVKLAEVYYSQKDQAGFEQYAEKVKSEVGEGSDDWQNIIAMGKELAPSSALFAGAAAGAAALASSTMDKPEVADIDIGLDAELDGESFADASLEDTIIENESAVTSSAQDISIDEVVDEFEDDPIASKIMQANETSDILNFDVDDIADDILEEEGGDLDSVATGLHETATMSDLTEEIEEIGMHTTMNDLKPLDIDEDVLGTETLVDDATEEVDLGIETLSEDPEATLAFTSTPQGDPEATAAFSSAGLDESLNATEQFDASSMDTEFLDPAEQTIAQTHTDLEELGPPSLIEEVGTKLDLAKAFVDMGDSDAAKETLIEVISEGDESQIKAAKDLMDKLGG